MHLQDGTTLAPVVRQEDVGVEFIGCGRHVEGLTKENSSAESFFFFFFLNQHLYPATPTTPILTITEADKRSGSAVLYYERVGGN